jgi:hypothetical protein
MGMKKRAGGGLAKCMDDAPSMRECFFVVLIPFVLRFLVFDTATTASSLFFLIVVSSFFEYTPPLIHSCRVCEQPRKRAREHLLLMSNPPDFVDGINRCRGYSDLSQYIVSLNCKISFKELMG